LAPGAPCICLDSRRKNTLVLFSEYPDIYSYSVITTLLLNEQDEVINNPFSTFTTFADLNMPDCAYSTMDDFYVAVFNFVEQVDDNTYSGIESFLINASTYLTYPNYFDMGTSNDQDNYPQINYSPYNDEFMLVYETGSAVDNIFNIVGTGFYIHTINNDNATIARYNVTVNHNSQNHEHDPHLQYNSELNQFMVVWGHGDDQNNVTKKNLVKDSDSQFSKSTSTQFNRRDIESKRLTDATHLLKKEKPTLTKPKFEENEKKNSNQTTTSSL